jgi:hypothetical protein
MVVESKIGIQSNKISPIKESLNGELSEKIFYKCEFCEKTAELYPYSRRMHEKLSGGSFYCGFCLGNNFNNKNNKNILILSFRAIIGYYYYNNYLTTMSAYNKMWLSEINDYIEIHRKVGLQNPVFRYDPESFLWFVDFSKVGRGRKKIGINEVLKTIVNILSCFNLYHIMSSIKLHKVYEKFQEAIVKFHSNRYRPEKRKMLIPTLVGCSGYETKEKEAIMEYSRTIVHSNLIAR